MKDRVLTNIDLTPTFTKEIKAKYFIDEDMNDILEKRRVFDKAQDAAMDSSGVLIFRERIYVPLVDGITKKTL